MSIPEYPLDPELAGPLARCAALAAKRKAEKSGEEAPVMAPVVYLAAWPDQASAVPNIMARSALFGAIRKGRRRYLKREKIAALDGIDIFFTGERLDQADLDVHLAVLQIMRSRPLGKKIRIPAYQILKVLGKTDTGKNRTILHSRITRMVATAVEVKQGRFSYIGSLIVEAFKDEHTHEWVIELNPQLAPLFEADRFTLVEWDARRALDGKPLAQWLHSFFASHAKPYPITVATLHGLCGSENGALAGFRQELRSALAAVAAITSWTWEIDDGDLVHLEKTPSRSQARHLARRKDGGPKRRR